MSALIQRDGILQVTGDINFDTVVALREEGDRYIQKASADDILTFDLSAAQYVDSSILPLLISWLRSGQSHQVQVGFSNVPSALQQIAKVCGLLPWIN